jgi:hypothetical protein
MFSQKAKKIEKSRKRSYKNLNMKSISIENCKSIEEQLIKLGFANTQDILETATHPFNLINSGEPPVRAILMFDTKSDLTRMYSFVVAKSETNQWYLHSIEAAGSVKTLRNPEGILSDGLLYKLRDRRLPHKDQMIKDLAEMTEIKKIRERFGKIHFVKYRRSHKR